MDVLPEFLQNIIASFITHWVIWVYPIVGAAVIGVAKKFWELVSTPWRWAIIGGSVIFFIMLLIEQSNQRIETLDKLANAQIEALQKLEQDRPTRPYFTLVRSEIQSNPKSRNDFIVVVQNNNVPAEDVVSHLMAIQTTDPTVEPLHTNRVENANAVGPGGNLMQRWVRVSIPPNAVPVYVLFQIQYTDVLRDKTHSQAFFLKFLGASQDGTFDTSLHHARSEEKDRILRYMEERVIPML